MNKGIDVANAKNLLASQTEANAQICLSKCLSIYMVDITTNIDNKRKIIDMLPQNFDDEFDNKP